MNATLFTWANDIFTSLKSITLLYCYIFSFIFLYSSFHSLFSDDYPIIDCCIVTSSTLTSFCQPGDIVVKINKKVCIACPLVTSGITTGGISGMVKSVEKSLNRSKGARKVRFLRLPNVLAASPGSASVTSVLTKNSPVNTRVLTPAEAALLLEEQDSNEIRQLDVENNRGSVSFRNSISFRNSLTLSLSLALSPNRTLATTAPTNSVWVDGR